MKRDKEQATLLLYSAAMLGQAQALDELQDLSSPAPSHSLHFLGTPLDQTDKNTLRAALRKHKIPTLREGQEYYCDVYDIAPLLPQGRTLSVCYSQNPNANLALLKMGFAGQEGRNGGAAIHALTEHGGGDSAKEKGRNEVGKCGNAVVRGEDMEREKERSEREGGRREEQKERGKGESKHAEGERVMWERSGKQGPKLSNTWDG